VILNPLAEVQTTRGADGVIDGLRIVAPVKGRGLQRTWISRETDPESFGRIRRAVLTALFDAQSRADPWSRAPVEAHDLFVRSGLFVTSEGISRPVRCELSLGDFDVARAAVMRHESFTLVRGAFAAAALAALRRYCRDLVAEGFAAYGNHDGALRWVAHNDPVARTIHPLLVPSVSAIVGETMKPSFSYLVRYLEGAGLAAHKDREQCDATAVLQVDFEPASDGPTPWPLVFTSARGREEARMAPGDMIVFRGNLVEHHRDPLTCGRSSTNLAFCFVPADYAGSLD
jgi:hypothetical protein